MGTRRLVHWNVAAHPTAEWTVQQFRTCVTGETTHRFVVHDRDSIYSPAVDDALDAMRVRVLKTPVMAPQANAYGERVIGTARRECLDWVIPLDERHLRRVLPDGSVTTIAAARMRPSAGLPDASSAVAVSVSDHHLFRAHRVTVRPILGGLHDEYGLETASVTA